MKDTDTNNYICRGTTILVLFWIVVICGFGFSVTNLKDIVTVGSGLTKLAFFNQIPVSSVSTAFDDYYDALYSSLPVSLEAFSVTQRVLCKHETRSFEVLKANDGQLYLRNGENEVDKDSLRIIADQYEYLYDVTNESGGRFLFVQAPIKNAGQASELAAYTNDITEESENILIGLLCERGIPVLDLRDFSDCCEYYHTDHHWTMQSAFNASNILLEEIEKLYGIDLRWHEFYRDLSNYNVVTYKNSLLGSIGVKVGPYFAGKDDFSVYVPRFDTDLEFRHYVNGELQSEHQGVFAETFIDQNILDDGGYYNKYNAFMYGAWVESVINNNMAQKDNKCLLITHSYGRPMAPYMSLNFGELRFIDPQEGRFEGDVAAYIRNYQPDVVILMFDGAMNVGDA